MKHAELIETLGGAPAVARALGTDADRVYQWKRAGVAWKWRAKVAQLAAANGASLPNGFLDPDGEAKPARRNGAAPKARRNGKKQAA